LAARAARCRVPVVNVWMSSPACHLFPGVFPDYAAMGRMRAEHLLARGLRRFAALTLGSARAQQVELKAFVGAVNEAGHSCACDTVSLNSASSVAEWRRTERTIARWMKGWTLPVGVYVGSETHGRIVAQACRNRGWRVPADVAIIAGQNELTLCEGLRPTLSSVEVGFERVGYEAARLLDRLMGGGEPPAEPILIAPTGLVVRESTDFLSADDPLVAAALTWIAANSHADVGQSDVASAVGAEVRTLQRRFQRHLGRSVTAEIRRARVERAKRELAHGTRPVKEIARSAGFAGPARLHEVFKRELGVAPGAYRRERQSRERPNADLRTVCHVSARQFRRGKNPESLS
jgi:LacI family transcriptional regulator